MDAVVKDRFENVHFLSGEMNAFIDYQSGGVLGNGLVHDSGLAGVNLKSLLQRHDVDVMSESLCSAGKFSASGENQIVGIAREARSGCL